MEERIRSHFRWPSLILGIIFIGLGIWSLMRPGAAIKGIVWIIALAMLLSGIFSLIAYFDVRSVIGQNHWASLLSGVLDIVLAILVFMNLNGSFLFLGYIFAFWFLFDSITAIEFGSFFPRSGLNMFLAILGILAGIAMLFNPILGAITVVYLLAFYLFLFGILLLVRAF
ncbi:HdeD family acid-resistance protein [Lacticaseibacillus brantae]|uniref:Acid-resistance membrane protein n=1 Tax=Lacticaseibacillus brantae DSM 23927 TaxID=1423727 RepID=A0A0R2B5W5_9LACO|nr:DUF308 domain-containing protein [Lacticaseibacillus brantae]KRM71657.1 hypothetical protein FC34_GL001314 [Lacticaseibacillus brantae DSM 23927]